MKIPVLIEAVRSHRDMEDDENRCPGIARRPASSDQVTEDHRFRATGGEPFAAAVEADTPEAALDKLRRGIVERVEQGGRITALDLPGGFHPWHQVFGMFRDDPLFDEWQQAISDNRRIVDDSEEGA